MVIRCIITAHRRLGLRLVALDANARSCVLAVRDSKDPEGPALTVPATAWRVLLRTVTR